MTTTERGTDMDVLVDEDGLNLLIEPLSLEETDPIELEEAPLSPKYLKAARRHVAGRAWWRRTVDPLRGTGAQN